MSASSYHTASLVNKLTAEIWEWEVNLEADFDLHYLPKFVPAYQHFEYTHCQFDLQIKWFR